MRLLSVPGGLTVRGALLLSMTLIVACNRLERGVVHLQSPDRAELRVAVEVAGTPEKQQRGLMERTELLPDSGMLFLYDQDQPLAFWMKNTRIALDILFFDGTGRFVSSATMVPCGDEGSGERCPTYHSAGNARFALEVPAGYVQAHSIGSDWMMKFSQ